MVCINCELMQSIWLGKPITILISSTRKAKGIFSKGTSNSQQAPIDGSFALNTKLYKDQNPERVSKLKWFKQKNTFHANFLSEPESKVRYRFLKILSENMAFKTLFLSLNMIGNVLAMLLSACYCFMFFSLNGSITLINEQITAQPHSGQSKSFISEMFFRSAWTFNDITSWFF